MEWIELSDNILQETRNLYRNSTKHRRDSTWNAVFQRGHPTAQKKDKLPLARVRPAPVYKNGSQSEKDAV